MKTGDCEDLVLLCMYMCHWGMNESPSLVIIYKIVDDGYHAIMGLNDSYIEVQYYNPPYSPKYTYNLEDEFSYEAAMAEAAYRRNLK